MSEPIKQIPGMAHVVPLAILSQHRISVPDLSDPLQLFQKRFLARYAGHALGFDVINCCVDGQFQDSASCGPGARRSTVSNPARRTPHCRRIRTLLEASR